MKKLALLLGLVFFAETAYADTCATSLMPAFTANQAKQLCGVFGSSVAISLVPQTDNTIDLGSASKSWRTLYTGTSRIAKTSDILRVQQDANRLFTWDASSDTTLTQTFGDGGVTAAQTFAISGSTADADDDSILRLCAAGLCNASTRGSTLQIGGNEASDPGIYAFTGATATADATFAVTDDFIVETVAGADSLVIDTATAAAGFTGTIRSSATADLGWSVVNVADQACNTTCTSACVVGIDTLGTGGFLGCAIATADSCICAGAS